MNRGITKWLQILYFKNILKIFGKINIAKYFCIVIVLFSNSVVFQSRSIV